MLGFYPGGSRPWSTVEEAPAAKEWLALLRRRVPDLAVLVELYPKRPAAS